LSEKEDREKELQMRLVKELHELNGNIVSLGRNIQHLSHNIAGLDETLVRMPR
jgi:hypothetical protein